jgi:hypothetical protein
VILPSIHTDRLADALTNALCDGNKHVIIPTSDGVARRRCPGCRSCTPTPLDPGQAMAEQRRRLHAIAVFEAADDEELAF